MYLLEVNMWVWKKMESGNEIFIAISQIFPLVCVTKLHRKSTFCTVRFVKKLFLKIYTKELFKEKNTKNHIIFTRRIFYPAKMLTETCLNM